MWVVSSLGDVDLRGVLELAIIVLLLLTFALTITLFTNPRWLMNVKVLDPLAVAGWSIIINWLIVISITLALSGIPVPKT